MRLKVLFLPTMNSGIVHYRMYQYKEAFNRLKLADAAMTFYDPRDDQQAEWQWYADKDPRLYGTTGELAHLIKQADVIVTQYVHTPQALALIEAMKATFQHPEIEAEHGKKVFLAEIDDDVLDTPPWNAAYSQYGPNNFIRNNVIEFLRAMDGVVVSTPFLAKKYKELNPHVYIVPNAINLKAWDKYPTEHSKKEIRIGWSGGGTHDDDLRTIEAPIKEILAENKDVTFHILNGCPDFFKDQSKITWHRDWFWIDRYPAGLKRLRFDIGIAPLVDCDFNRGKSNLRNLEYAALGIPAVCANVGHFKETLSGNPGVFLYDDAKGFKTKLQALIDSPEMRTHMGRHNHRWLAENFHVDRVAHHYASVLKAALRKGKTRDVDVRDRRGQRWIEPLAATTSH